METIIIAAPLDIKIEDLIKKIPNSFSVIKQNEFRYLISLKENHCWIEHDDSLKLDYEEELVIVNKHIPNPKFFCCEFSEINFGKEVLSYIANNKQYIIDNDHGDIIVGNDFVKRLKEEPNWDWRI